MKKEQLINEAIKTQLDLIEERAAAAIEILHKSMKKTHRDIMISLGVQLFIAAAGLFCWLIFYRTHSFGPMFLADLAIECAILTGVIKSISDILQERNDYKKHNVRHNIWLEDRKKHLQETAGDDKSMPLDLKN